MLTDPAQLWRKVRPTTRHGRRLGRQFQSFLIQSVRLALAGAAKRRRLVESTKLSVLKPSIVRTCCPVQFRQRPWPSGSLGGTSSFTTGRSATRSQTDAVCNCRCQSINGRRTCRAGQSSTVQRNNKLSGNFEQTLRKFSSAEASSRIERNSLRLRLSSA